MIFRHLTDQVSPPLGFFVDLRMHGTDLAPKDDYQRCLNLPGVGTPNNAGFFLPFRNIYLCETSFGQKYYHCSLLREQIDIYLRKVYVVRKVTSAPTFLALSNTCLCDVYRTRQVLKIDL